MPVLSQPGMIVCGLLFSEAARPRTHRGIPLVVVAMGTQQPLVSPCFNGARQNIKLGAYFFHGYNPPARSLEKRSLRL